MAADEAAASANWGPLASVLLDFGKAPGRYSLRLGEPPALHAQLDTVALWAMGRIPLSVQAPSAALQDAAIAFVQRVCFAPDNTHYQVLGLNPHALDAEVLRARYRTLIRLAHPDMGVRGLPPDAAGMVNRAHEVLGNAHLRSNYDQQLSTAAAQLRTVPKPIPPHFAERNAASGPWLHSKSHPNNAERWQAWMARFPGLVRFFAVGGSIGTLVAMVLAWAAMNTREDSSLVVARAPVGSASFVNRQEQPQGQGPNAKAKAKEQATTPTAASTMDSKPLTKAPSKPASGAATDSMVAATALRPVAEHTPPERPLVEQNPPAFLQGRSAQRTPFSTPLSAAVPAPLAADLATGGRPVEIAAPAPALEVATNSTPSGLAEKRSVASVPLVNTAVPQSHAAGSPDLQGTKKLAPVDLAQARTYLVELLHTLERHADAQKAQAYLGRMQVRGNLLAGPLRLAQHPSSVQVAGIALSPVKSAPASATPGLSLTGTLLLRAGTAASTQEQQFSYRVLAQFTATEKGPALAQLDLWELVD